MPNESDQLLDAVKESLKRDGIMNKFQAEVRAAVMTVLNTTPGTEGKQLPEMKEDAKIINDLIQEYFAWMGFRYAEQVLAAECGRNESYNRNELESKLHFANADPLACKMPLLFNIVAKFLHKQEYKC